MFEVFPALCLLLLIVQLASTQEIHLSNYFNDAMKGQQLHKSVNNLSFVSQAFLQNQIAQDKFTFLMKPIPLLLLKLLV
jgi:hypothetical protein